VSEGTAALAFWKGHRPFVSWNRMRMKEAMTKSQ
jgi:hypothetical protein